MSVKSILENQYGLKPINISSMEGYVSTNFRVETADGIYVCKKYPGHIRVKDEILAEDRVLKALKGLDPYQFPLRIDTLSGEPYAEEGESYYRLLTFVNGVFLGSVPHTPGLLYSLGQCLGRMDSRLSALYEPAVEAKRISWDLRHIEKSVPLLNSISDPSDRSLVSYFFLQFEDQIRPVAHRFRQALIYNDANDWNVLTDGTQVTGIIDFGDLCFSWLVNEVAIGMTYAMMGKEQPLDQGLKVLEGYQSEVPLTELECDSLYYLIAGRLCISLCNSAYAARQQPGSAYVTISEQGARTLLRQLLRINPVQAGNRFREVCGFPKAGTTPLSKLLSNRKEHFGSNLSLSYRNPIHMDRAAFQYMYDADGNTFLDAYNNIMLVGHCHPRVVDAGQRAMARLNTNTRYLYDVLEAYSKALLKKFPSQLSKVYFVNSGSEASDLAIRMAKYHTGKEVITVVEHGYHGHTQGGMEISSYKYRSKGGSGKPENTLELPLPKVFGSPWADDGSAGLAYAKKATELIEECRGDIAAFIAEPIVGCGGQVPLAKGYLNALYPVIRAQGGVCISDEVQVGFGRLGETYWGFELFDVVPDIVILGKPMGNGHPMGAVVTTAEIAESFGEAPEFFSSFGGNPVSCAIGLSVLEVVDEEERQDHAKDTGNYLKMELQQLQKKHGVIGDVRGYGLFLGIELTAENGSPLTELASVLKNSLRDQFVLVSTDGPHENVIKIKPPLCFTCQNADELVSKIDTILATVMVI